MIQKIKTVIVTQLKQGVSPHGLALTFAMAVILGIFPILGSTTLLCFVFAWLMKLNQPLIHALNYIVYPFQIALIPVFLKMGRWIFGAPPISLYPDQILKEFFEDWVRFFENYGEAGLHAITAWTLVAPFLALAIYSVMRPTLERINKRRQG